MTGHYERILIAIAMWACLGAALFVLRRQSPLHLCVLAVLSTALVGAFYPVLTVFVEASSWRNVAQASESVVQGVQFEYLAFAAGMALAVTGAWLLGWVPRGCSEIVEHDDPRVRHRDTWVSILLLGLGGALYAGYVAKVGMSALLNRDDYAEKYLLSQGLGPLAFGLNMMMAACLWAEASRISPVLRWSFRGVAVAIAVWSIAMISVRTNVVILAIGYGWVLCRARKIELKRVRPLLVALLLVMYAAMECFSLFRGASQEVGSARALELIGQYSSDSLSSVVGGSELSHPFLTTLEVSTYELPGDLGGQSYLDAFPAYLPKAINPDAPKALSERFVRTQYSDLDERGGGTAFSIVAEAWWNFGSIFGPLIVGILAASVLLFVERIGARSPSSLVARLAPYCVYLVIIAHRSEFAVLFKQGVTIFLPALVLVYAVELAWMARHAADSGRERTRLAPR